MSYIFKAPDTFTRDRLVTSTEEVKVEEGFARCETMTAKQVLLAHGFEELDTSIPPKQQSISPIDQAEVEEVSINDDNKKKVEVKPSYEIEIIKPKK